MELPPDRYLVVFRKEGRIDVRYPVLVERGKEHRNTVRLPEAAPEGFVYVPGGEFIAGEDPEASNYGGRRQEGRRTVEDFFIAKFEVTCAEYLEYLNDGEWHDAAKAARKAPRQAPGAGYYWEAKEGMFSIGRGWLADEPVGGISWEDGTDYAKWFSKKHGGDEWEFRLPAEEEWEKAARGTDGRYHVWGDRFTAAFCSMLESRSPMPNSEPYGLFAADESPYGVRDMAGIVREMTSTAGGPKAELRVFKGGARGDPSALCRAAFRFVSYPSLVFAYNGVRLAAARAPQDF